MSAILENIQGISWITPEQQFMRLIPSKIAFEKSMHYRRDSGAVLDIHLIDMITDYFVMTAPQLKYWYTALKELDLLPKLIPALPDHIHDILFSNCPIMDMQDKLKQDGEPYKVFETHSLYLIPPNSLNDLQDRAWRYGRDKLGIEYNNPWEFRGFFDLRRIGKITSDKWEWALLSNTVIEESRGGNYTDQVQTIERLNQRSGAGYEIPNLREMGAFLFFHKIATDESLYGNDQQNGYRTFTRVQDRYEKIFHLAIGGYDQFGVCAGDVADTIQYEDWLGIAALRKFSQLPPTRNWTSCYCIIT